MKMKRALALLLVLMFALATAACAKPAASPATAPAASQDAPAAAPASQDAPAAEPVAAPEVAPETAPAESLVVYDDSEYASMTVEELYEAAKKEGGKLVVYTETSSTAKSQAKFMEEFPGIEMEVTKYKNFDINSLIPLEAEGTAPYCDMVVAGDTEGSKYYEWYQKGYAVSYIPAELKDDLKEEYLAYGLPITIEGDIWYYSKNTFPDGSPINNWWDVVEMDANGKSIYKLYMHDPSNLTTGGMLCNLVYLSDELEAAYKEKYGKDIEYTYNADELGVEPNNAGYEWLYRYLQCDYTVITDSDEILATIDKSTEPALGLATSLKYGDTIEAGLNVSFCTGMTPCSGFAKVKYVYICANTDNPAAARLFTIYQMGGADGQGAGYGAYVNRNGCYGVRKSHDDSTHSDFSLEELTIRPSQIGFVYDTILDVQDFWTYYVDTLKK